MKLIEPLRTQQGTRVGRFKLSGEFFREIPEAMVHIQEGLAVVHIEQHAYNDSVEFTAIGPMFDFVTPGQIIPLYDVYLQSTEDGEPDRITFIFQGVL